MANDLLEEHLPPEDDEEVADEGANGEIDEDSTESLIGVLRQRHEEIRKGEYHLDRPLPGYDDLIWVRFRPFKISKSEKVARKAAVRMARNEEGAILDLACQNLIDACDRIMLLQPKFKGEPGEHGENLVDIDDEVPIKFDQRLADMLKIELNAEKTSRGVIKALFPTEQGIVTMSAQLSRWLNDVTKEANETFLGE